MKNRRQVLIFAGTIIVVIAGVFSYVAVQVNKFPARQFLLNTFSRYFPNAEIRISDISKSTGTMIKFGSDNLFFNFIDKDVQLSVRHVKARIPIWYFLFKRGKIDLYFNEPTLVLKSGKEIHELPEVQKLSFTIPQTKPVKTKKVEEKKSFIEGAKLNVRVTNLDVFQVIKEEKSRYFHIDKLVFKNINMSKSAAFTLSTKHLSKNVDQTGSPVTEYDLLVVGDFNLKKYAEQGELDTNMVIKIVEGKFPNLLRRVKTAQADISLAGSFKRQLNFMLNIAIHEESNVKLSGIISKDLLEIQKISGQVATQDLVDFFVDPKLAINSGSTNLAIEGKLKKKGDRIVQNIKVKNDFPLEITLQDGPKMAINVEGEIDNDNVNIRMTSEVENGSFNVAYESLLDLNNFPKKIKNLKGAKLTIKASNFNYPTAFLRNFFQRSVKVQYLKEKKDLDKKVETRPVANKITTQSVSDLAIAIELDNLLFNQKPMSGVIQAKSFDGQIKVAPSNINWNKGKLSVRGNMSKAHNHLLLGSLNFDLDKMDFLFLHPFLPKFFENIHGRFTGPINFHLKESKLKKAYYEVGVKLNGAEGELKNLNLNKHIMKNLKVIPLFNYDSEDEITFYRDEFDLIELDAQFRPNHFKINSFYVLGKEGSYKAKGQGNLFPQNDAKRGKIDFVFTDREGPVGHLLNELIGLQRIPIRLDFNRLRSKFNVPYSVSYLAKRVFKGKSKRGLNKIKDNLLNSNSKTLQKVIHKYLR